MSKKDKKACSLPVDFQAVIDMIPRLKGFIKIHQEIAEGYQQYRKNGGVEIPGIEKHLGCKEEKSKCCEVTRKEEKEPKNQEPEQPAEVKKAKKKDK